MAWTLTNADVITAFPLLADHYEKADSGSTTTLVSGRLTDLAEDELVGATIGFINGDNAGTDAVVTSYTDTTGSFGFATIANAVDGSTGFGIIYIDFTSHINRAFAIIKNEMRNRGLDADLFITTTHVKELHLLKTLELICMSKRQDADSDDIYHESYLTFRETYISELNNLKADYDTSEDGTIQEVEKKQSKQVVLSK